jgi:hypothetical protein
VCSVDPTNCSPGVPIYPEQFSRRRPVVVSGEVHTKQYHTGHTQLQYTNLLASFAPLFFVVRYSRSPGKSIWFKTFLVG